MMRILILLLLLITSIVDARKKIKNLPSVFITSAPTNAPTNAPTTFPTSEPTNNPTLKPSVSPSNVPSTSPTNAPSSPTNAPIILIIVEYPPTLYPTPYPTQSKKEKAEPYCYAFIAGIGVMGGGIVLGCLIDPFIFIIAILGFLPFLIGVIGCYA